MPDSDQSTNDERNERQVLDPVAHLPVLVHDSTNEELRAVRIPHLTDQNAQSMIRDVMGGVVWQEADSGRWKDVSVNKAKMQIAMFTALAVCAGSTVTLWLFCLLGRGWPYGWLDLFRACLICSLVALASGAAILLVKHPALQPHPQDNTNPEVCISIVLLCRHHSCRSHPGRLRVLNQCSG